MTKEFCESLSIDNYLNMKFQIGVLEDSKNKLVTETPPAGSKFDGTDGWL
jgi:hypothetical protein